MELLTNTETLYNYVSALKKIKRRLDSNMYLSDEELQILISKKKLQYIYQENEYLLLLEQTNHFTRLYYYLASEDFPIPEIEPLVCELFASKPNDSVDRMRTLLENKGFKNTGPYHKWILRHDTDKVILNEKYEITKERTSCIHDKLKPFFNVYLDHLPDDVEEYYADKDVYIIREKATNEIAGSLVTIKHGKIVTMEYLFIDENHRGNYLSKVVFSHLFNEYLSQEVHFVAWVKDDNIGSVKLHIFFDFDQTTCFKETLIKGV